MFSYEQVVDDLTRIAKEKNPQKMACYIYYVMKQFRDCPFITEYDKNIDKTSLMVTSCFGWSKKETTQLEKQISEFTKYMIK